MKKLIIILLAFSLFFPSLVKAEDACVCEFTTSTPAYVLQTDVTQKADCDIYVIEKKEGVKYKDCRWGDSKNFLDGKNYLTGGSSDLVSDIKGIDTLNQLKDTDIKVLLGKIILAAMGMMGSIALLMFVYGGVLWMLGSSGGESKNITKAQNIIKWSVLGIIVIMASYAIVDFLFKIF